MPGAGFTNDESMTERRLRHQQVESEEVMMPMYQKILVGYDGSKGGRAALERAAVAAKHYHAQVTALWVREPLPRHSRNWNGTPSLNISSPSNPLRAFRSCEKIRNSGKSPCEVEALRKPQRPTLIPKVLRQLCRPGPPTRRIFSQLQVTSVFGTKLNIISS